VPNAEVHQGFNDAYAEMSSQVISGMNKYLVKYSTASILVTGHSLGAALATLAAIDIKSQVKTQNKLFFYSFGSPRVGNQ
jgi:predicted lipase